MGFNEEMPWETSTCKIEKMGGGIELSESCPVLDFGKNPSEITHNFLKVPSAMCHVSKFRSFHKHACLKLKSL